MYSKMEIERFLFIKKCDQFILKLIIVCIYMLSTPRTTLCTKRNTQKRSSDKVYLSDTMALILKKGKAI